MSFKILRENNYLFSMISYHRNSLFKIVLGQNFYNCEPILKILAAHSRTNQAPNSAMKIISIKLNKIEDIPVKPLSESKNYTLNEPCREKTGLRGFRPCPTQTGLYSHRRWLEA